MDESGKLSRRELIRYTSLGIAGVALGGGTLIARAGDESSLPHLQLTDPMAKALHYTNESPHKDEHCHNCRFLQGKAGPEWRPCQLFPGKLVHVDGYCNSWTAIS